MSRNVTRYGEAPPERPRGHAPKRRGLSAAPKAHAVGRAPVPLVGKAPPAHAIGKVPNPRRPKLVRDVDGGELKDLFAVFPDLPRPARPAARTRTRVARRSPRR